MRIALILAGLGFGLLVVGPASGSVDAGPLAQATATPTTTATPTRTPTPTSTPTPHCQIQMRRGTLATPTWQTVPWWFESWGGGVC